MQTQSASLRGSLVTHRLPGKANAVGGGAHILTAECVKQFTLTVTGDTCNPDNFPLVHLQIHRRQMGAKRV